MLRYATIKSALAGFALGSVLTPFVFLATRMVMRDVIKTTIIPMARPPLREATRVVVTAGMQLKQLAVDAAHEL